MSGEDAPGPESHAAHDAGCFLRSPRLGFRHWRDEDAPLAMALWGDPDVTRLIGGPFDPARVRERLAREIAQQRDAGMSYWPVFRLGDQAFVGCCGLRPCDPAMRVLEIGFHLRPAFHGQGFAEEAARATIRHAFDALGAHALFAGHHPGNAASARLLARLGFRYDHDAFYAPTGLMHPSYLLARRDSDAER